MTRLNVATVAVAVALTLLAKLSMVPQVEAIKFELQGQHFAEAIPHCISHYVDDETEVVVKVMVGNGVHQKVSVEVSNLPCRLPSYSLLPSVEARKVNHCKACIMTLANFIVLYHRSRSLTTASTRTSCGARKTFREIWLGLLS